MPLLFPLALACAPAIVGDVGIGVGEYDSGQPDSGLASDGPDSVGAAGIGFTPEHGVVDATFELTLSVGYTDVELRYTTDASDPRTPGNLSATVYDGPIAVDHNTVVRVAAFRGEEVIGDLETRTWVFPGQVLDQVQPAGWPETWFDAYGTGPWNEADYEMDPEVVDADRGAAEAALWGLPTVSLVVELGDLFGSSGIYDRPDASGEEWERPAAVELLPTDSEEGFVAPAGVRIHGGASRDPEYSPKKSFRLVFKEQYGASKLDYPLYAGSDVDEFDGLVLRAGYNHSWVHWDPTQRSRSLYVRDAFAADGQLATGQRSPQNRAVQLYINGVYWGLYRLTERPDARAMAAWYGGESADWDVMNTGEAVDGNDSAWSAALALAAAGDTQALKAQVDVDNLVDYMLLNFYLGNDDWPYNNWYAARQRPDGLWRFFEWDAEHTLKELDTDVTGVADEATPAQLWSALLEDPDFRATVSARAAELLADDGPLGVDAALERFAARIDEVGPAVVAESARWGDYRRDVYCYASDPCPLYTVAEHWEVERQRLEEEYLPARTAVVQAQVAARGW